jgi:hypothetical protein
MGRGWLETRVCDVINQENVPTWTHYLETFAMPWFSRTWGLQEVALTRKAVVRFGRFVFSWDSLVKSHSFCVKYRVHLRLMSMFKILDLCPVGKSGCERTNTLFLVILATATFLVTDPRDKVIGILRPIGRGPTQADVVSG